MRSIGAYAQFVCVDASRFEQARCSLLNKSLLLRQRQEIRTTAVRISCFFRFWKGFKRVGSRLVTRDLYFTKKISHFNKMERKTLRRKKKRKIQNIADERRITVRFAKRYSGERPVSLGFELTFLSEFK